MKPAAGTRRVVASNRRARHDYELLETFECGIALTGGEVKSLRNGRAALREAYARIERGEVWLVGAHIGIYEHATGFGAHDPVRPRKLLLHRRQIDELAGRVEQRSLTLVPLAIYFLDGLVKVEIALARGRKTYDKRQALATKDAQRQAADEMARALKGHTTRRRSRQR
ncbi:MAG: SsrA-binding protein SmpB [Acidimicrobiales bacterium]